MIFIENAFSNLEKLKFRHQRNILSFSPFWALLLQLPKSLNYPITSKRCLLLTKNQSGIVSLQFRSHTTN